MQQNIESYSKLFRNEGFIDFYLGQVSLRDGKIRFFCPKAGELKFIRYNEGECAFSKKRKTSHVDLSLNYPFYLKGEGMKNVSEKDIIINSSGLYVLANVIDLDEEYFKKLNALLKFKSTDELNFKVAGIQVNNPNQEYLCEYLSTTEQVNEWKSKSYKASKVAKHVFVTKELKDFPMEVLIPLARQQRMSLLVIAPDDFLPEKERLDVDNFFGPDKMKEVLDQTISSKVNELSRIVLAYENYEFIDRTPFIKELGSHRVFEMPEYKQDFEDFRYRAAPPALSERFLELLAVHNVAAVTLAREVATLGEKFKDFLATNPEHKAFCDLVTRRWGLSLMPSEEVKILLRLAFECKNDKN